MPTPPGRAGASSPSGPSSSTCASGWASPSSVRPPRRCGCWATRSRPSAWPPGRRCPVVPWGAGAADSLDTARLQARFLGFPVVAEGRGRRRAVAAIQQGVRRRRSCAEAFDRVRDEARRLFGDSSRVRRAVDRRSAARRGADRGRRPRHDVGRRHPRRTVQRRHQKVLEESPAPGLPPDMDRAAARGRAALCRAAGYRERRRGRVPVRAGHRPALLHGGEPLAAGRAPGHRADDRPRPRDAADPPGARRPAARASRRRRAATRSRCASRPRTPSRVRAGARRRSAAARARRAPGCGSTAASTRATWCGPSTTRCSPS